MEKSLIAVLNEVESEGTYVCVNFSDVTIEALNALVKDLGIDEATRPDDFHATVVYSRKSIPWKKADELDIEAKITGYTIFDTRDGKKCLVLLIDSPWLHERFERAMSLGATYDFPEYKPHITLSYDYGDADAPETVPTFPIVIASEHVSSLRD